MGEDTHTDDIRNVNEEDTAVITTTDGEKMEVVCTKRETHNADDPNIIRETTLWHFDHNGTAYIAGRVDGIAGHPDVGPFPKDKPLFNTDTEESVGLIDSVKLLGVVV